MFMMVNNVKCFTVKFVLMVEDNKFIRQNIHEEFKDIFFIFPGSSYYVQICRTEVLILFIFNKL
jgi:hypothetical protein